MRANTADRAARRRVRRAYNSCAGYTAAIDVRHRRDGRVDGIVFEPQNVFYARLVEHDVLDLAALGDKLEKRPMPAVVLDAQTGKAVASAVEHAEKRLRQLLDIRVFLELGDSAVIYVVGYKIMLARRAPAVLGVKRFVIIHRAQVERRAYEIG